MTNKIPGKIFSEPANDQNFSSSDLCLLSLGSMVFCKAHEEPINDIERRALSGMIAYVGYTKKVDEKTVCAILVDHYGIAKITALPSQLYQDAIEFLVDLKMNTIIN